MAADKIYSDLEGKLAQFYKEQKNVEPTKENISQYLTSYANLRYFVDRNTGKFLYKYDEEKDNFKGLDYESIAAQSPELLKKDDSGNVDSKATQSYIEKVFNEVNRSFQQLQLIQEFGNYSRFSNRFGKGNATSYLPEIRIDLRAMKDVSPIYKINNTYFVNAFNFMEKLSPKTYEALENKKKLVKNVKGEKPNDALWINDFLTAAERLCKPLKSKFSMNNYLDEKIMNLVSALDDIDKDECLNPLMPSRSTEHLIMHFNNKVSDEALIKYSTKDMKKIIDKLFKKNDEE